ncbi:unnamed protein product [Musa acuminata subsp. malaccensis]|uniref:(wild Malaysian banana) hypothetical protein n=1 Tax=Musa acuminata subsp. malaccensis TaxID=214687 RepID=A0A804HZ40_MUSAM|nr:unnamed protein product [Musa acuminata subsp. malaccensis]
MFLILDILYFQQRPVPSLSPVLLPVLSPIRHRERGRLGSKPGDLPRSPQIASPKGLVRRIHCYPLLWYRDSSLLSDERSIHIAPNGTFSSPLYGICFV